MVHTLQKSVFDTRPECRIGVLRAYAEFRNMNSASVHTRSPARNCSQAAARERTRRPAAGQGRRVAGMVRMSFPKSPLALMSSITMTGETEWCVADLAGGTGVWLAESSATSFAPGTLPGIAGSSERTSCDPCLSLS